MNIQEYEKFLKGKAELLIKGKKFCVSGRPFYFSSQEYLEKEIVKFEGIVKSSVTKDLDYLIWSGRARSSKVVEAETNKIKVISEKDFMKMIENDTEIKIGQEDEIYDTY